MTDTYPKDVVKAVFDAEWYLGIILHAYDRLAKNFIIESPILNRCNKLYGCTHIAIDLGIVSKDGWKQPRPSDTLSYFDDITRYGARLNRSLKVISDHINTHKGCTLDIIYASTWVWGEYIPIDFKNVYSECTDHDDYERDALDKRIKDSQLFSNILTAPVDFVAIYDAKYDEVDDGKVFKRGYFVFTLKGLEEYYLYMDVTLNDNILDGHLVNITDPHGWQPWTLDDETWKTLLHYGSAEFIAFEDRILTEFEKEYQRVLATGYLP